MACRAFKKVHVTWNVARTNSAPSLVNSTLPVWFCRWTFIQSLFVTTMQVFHCCLSNALLGVQWKVAWPAFPPSLCSVLPSDKPRTHSVYSSAIFSHSSRAMQFTLHSTCDSWLTAAGTIFLSSIPACADSFPGLGPPPTLHTFICQGTNEGVSFTSVSSPCQHWIMHVCSAFPFFFNFCRFLRQLQK